MLYEKSCCTKSGVPNMRALKKASFANGRFPSCLVNRLANRDLTAAVLAFDVLSH